MARRRCVVVHKNGDVYLADGKNEETGRTPFNLDALLQGGAKIDREPIPITDGVAAFMLVLVEIDPPVPPAPVQPEETAEPANQQSGI